jgi:outer membrane protein assembly factor BamA
VHSVTQFLQSPLARTRGHDGATIVGQSLNLRYDTRDNVAVPTTGTFADAAVEVVDTALGSTSSYLRYVAEARSYLSVGWRRSVLATQALLSYMQGGDRAPFYDRNALGGVRSLRGYGSNRFIDNHRCLVRSELRVNLWEPEWLQRLFQVRGHLEAAPFVELGQVFRSSRTVPFSDPHVDGGIAFRAILPPQLVAYVDFGTTGSSPSVFTGVDYPF